MDIIRLTPEEQALVIKYGTAIHENKKAKGTKKAAIDKKRDDEYLDVLGVAGEFAVCKYYGIPYKFQLFDVRDDQDIVLRGGYRADVKVCKYSDSLLKIPKWQIDKPYHLYILVRQISSLVAFEIVGWITTSAFKSQMQETIFKGYEHAPMYTLDRKYLERPEFLRPYVPVYREVHGSSLGELTVDDLLAE